MTYRKYFAYGSNMFAARLRARVPSAKVIGAYKLPCHDLRFHKRSDKDGSGKCDAYEANSGADFVMGRLFSMAQSEESTLDKAEGLHNGYEKKTVSVVDMDGNVEEAFTYYATCIDDSLRPYTWYKKHVLTGAKEAPLPDDYVRKIEAVSADEDPDREREREELALHGQQLLDNV